MCIVYHHLGTPIRWYEWARVHHPPPPGLTIFFCTPIRDSNSRCNYNPALWKKKKNLEGEKHKKMHRKCDWAPIRHSEIVVLSECVSVGGWVATDRRKWRRVEEKKWTERERAMDVGLVQMRGQHWQKITP